MFSSLHFSTDECLLSRTLYYSLVDPCMIYCVSVWGSTYHSNLHRIVTLQKKVVRIMSKVSCDSHTENLFQELNILKFLALYSFQIGNPMFLFTKGLLPNAFGNMFQFLSQRHSYNTRNSRNFYIFLCRTNIRQFSMSFSKLSH